jgi:hypothetical protein
MGYVIIKNPAVQMDLMVKKQYQPQLVSYMERMGVRYANEVTGTIWEDSTEEWVKLYDISGESGKSVGELIGLFYSLEWGHLTAEDEDKFYIMLHPARKGKRKHARKNRKETGTGSNGGDSGESSGYSEPGQVGGPAGDGYDAGDPGADDLWESPRIG